MKSRASTSDKRAFPNATPDDFVRHGLADLCVIIPAYNEETGIESTVCELRAALPEIEIIVLDDGSTDATLTVINVQKQETILYLIHTHGTLETQQ